MTTGNTTLLGLALPVEGELDGTWGDVVNDSLTSLVDSAVAGTTTLSADADVTLTDTALAANQARQAVILWTASNGASTRNVTAPARSKPYIVINAGTGSIVLRGAGPTTGVTIISGEKCLAAWNGSDFVKIATSTADGVTSVDVSGGTTGLTTSGGPVTSSGTITLAGTLAVANGGTGVTTSTGTGSVVLSNSPTLVTPALGTPSSGTLTNATGLPIDGGTTGTLPIARGGTNATTAPDARTSLGATTLGSNVFTITNPSAVTFPRFNADNTVSSLDAADFRTAIGAGIGAGSVTSVDVSGGTTGLTTSGGPVTSSGTITLAGTLSVANGGTGATTLTANNVILGNGTSAPLFVAPGTTGNVLTSDGTTWGSSPGATGDVTLTGTQTLTNKTIAFADNTLTDVAGTTATQTLTNKTISGADNTLTVDGTVPVGFRTIPQNSQSGAYTLVLADSGKHIFHPVGDNNARTFTIPANSSVAYPIGTAITFINMAVANVTIAITTDTLTLSPAGTTGSRTLATNGSATCIKITSTSWLISGSGLT